MKNISNYLDNFLKKINNNDEDYQNIIDILKSKLNIQLTKDDFEVKNSVLITNFSPAVKNKIFINKEDLILEINNTNKNKIVDIR